MAALETGNHGSRFHSTHDGWKAVFAARSARTWAGGGCILQDFMSNMSVRFSLSAKTLYEGHGNTHITIVGISQNEKKDTAAFIKQYGLTFPVLLDDTSTYEVSNAYGLTNVPTIFWIAQDGEIEVSSVGWIRKDMDSLISALPR